MWTPMARHWVLCVAFVVAAMVVFARNDDQGKAAGGSSQVFSESTGGGTPVSLNDLGESWLYAPDTTDHGLDVGDAIRTCEGLARGKTIVDNTRMGKYRRLGSCGCTETLL